MKVKAITNELLALLPGSKREYRTPDGLRIDVAVPDKKLAIELENTYSWIDRRILYNAVKAQRAGFKDLIIIYPFKDKVIQHSWVMKFIEEIGINLKIIKPDEIHKLINEK